MNRKFFFELVAFINSTYFALDGYSLNPPGTILCNGVDRGRNDIYRLGKLVRFSELLNHFWTKTGLCIFPSIPSDNCYLTGNDGLARFSSTKCFYPHCQIPVFSQFVILT